MDLKPPGVEGPSAGTASPLMNFSSLRSQPLPLHRGEVFILSLPVVSAVWMEIFTGKRSEQSL